MVHKGIDPWHLMEAATNVCFKDIAHLYRATAGAPGLVHAVEGPALKDGGYTVTLEPVGREGRYERPREEEDVRQMALGLLQGLAAIHGVRG